MIPQNKQHSSPTIPLNEKPDFFKKKIFSFNTYKNNFSKIKEYSDAVKNHHKEQTNTSFSDDKTIEPQKNSFHKDSTYTHEFNLPEFSPLITSKDTIFHVNTTDDKLYNREWQTSQNVYKDQKITIDFSLSQQDWMLWFIISTLLLFVWIRLLFKKTLFETFRSVALQTSSLRLFRENNQPQLRASFLMKFLFTLNFGFFTYLTIDHFTGAIPQSSALLYTLGISGIFIISYTLKYIILLIIGYLTDTVEITKIHLHHTALLNKVYGISLFPIIISIPYLQVNFITVKTLIITGWSLFILSYIIRITKSVVIGIQQKISLFYMILYLCTLEIIPLVVIYKLLINYLG